MISIIIPIYNSERHLSQCIESILKQTYTNFELLLINDGSCDNSRNICNRYAALDSRIKLFDIPNSGVSHARNLGISKASGEWITFIDSDDWISKDYLSSLYNNPQFDVLNMAQAYMCSNKKIKSWPILFPPKDYNWNENINLDFILVYGTPWGKLFNRQLLLNNKIFFDEHISNHEDHIFYFTYLLYVKQIHICRNGKYYYRISDSFSLSRKMPNHNLLLYAYQSLNTIYKNLLCIHKMDSEKLPQIKHFIMYLKIKPIRAVFFNENTDNERKRILSYISRKEIYKYYRCKSLSSTTLKFILLLPNFFRFFFLKKLRRHLG